MKTVLLTKGYVTLVDDEDYDFLNQWKWNISETIDGELYARRNEHRKVIFMHRVIIPVRKNQQVDHIDRNGLNNQKYNLRVCSASQNGANSGMSKNNTSGFKGVTWVKNAHKWMAQLEYRNQHLYLGMFNNPIEAAKIYDKKALELWGEFAATNKSLGLL